LGAITVADMLLASIPMAFRAPEPELADTLAE
jgi:hypothetical protein